MKTFSGNLKPSLAVIALSLTALSLLAFSGANGGALNSPVRQPLLERIREYRNKRQANNTCTEVKEEDKCDSLAVHVDVDVCQGRGQWARKETILTHTCKGHCHTTWEYGTEQNCRCCFPVSITSATKTFDCKDQEGTVQTIHYASSVTCECYSCLQRNRHRPHGHLHSQYH